MDHLVMNFRRYLIIVEYWRPEVARRLKKSFFAFFLEKTTLTGKFSKFCSKRIHRDTDWRVLFKFRKIWPSGNWQSRS